MEYVQDFITQLCESAQLEEYNRIRIYLDEDYTSAEHFTVSKKANIHRRITVGQFFCKYRETRGDNLTLIYNVWFKFRSA